MNKQTGSQLLKVIGSLAILAFLITRINWDPQQFTTVFNRLNLNWYLISLTGVILVLGFKSVRWNLLLKAEGCIYPYYSAFLAYMSSFTIGLLTPGRVGEIARLYYVRSERKIDFFHSFKTIVIDRIFDFAMLIWFGTSGILFYYKVLGNQHALLYLLIVGVIMLIAWITGKIILKMIKSDKQRVWFTFIYEAWTEMFHAKMIVPWLLTLLAYLIFYVANWFILLSLGQRITLTEVGFILSLMSLVTLIPITIAGFGTREASLIFLFSFYGLSPEIAVIFSLLQFIAFFLWGGLIGWLFWMIKPVKLSLIKDDAVKVFGYFKQINLNNTKEKERHDN